MKTILFLQAVYFFLTGLWALVHIKSFMAITGPKTDVWLVKTVGILIVAISISLFTAYFLTITLPIIVLAMASSFSLMIIDVFYSLSGRISLIYLLDAIIEAVLISCWIWIVIIS